VAVAPQVPPDHAQRGGRQAGVREPAVDVGGAAADAVQVAMVRREPRQHRVDDVAGRGAHLDDQLARRHDHAPPGVAGQRSLQRRHLRLTQPGRTEELQSLASPEAGEGPVQRRGLAPLRRDEPVGRLEPHLVPLELAPGPRRPDVPLRLLRRGARAPASGLTGSGPRGYQRHPSTAATPVARTSSPASASRRRRVRGVVSRRGGPPPAVDCPAGVALRFDVPGLVAHAWLSEASRPTAPAPSPRRCAPRCRRAPAAAGGWSHRGRRRSRGRCRRRPRARGPGRSRW